MVRAKGRWQRSVALFGWIAAGTVSYPAVSRTDQAVPKPKPPFGIVVFDLHDPVPALLASLGVGVIRGSCRWVDLEPQRGVFNWSCSDNVIVGAQGLHMRSYMSVVCTPDWANGGGGCAQMPTDIADWYSFVANFVARYTRYNVVLGIWNEPNLELIDTPDGSNYALLFLNASNARNAVNANFTIAGPETSHHAIATAYYVHTMQLIAAAGAFDKQDIVSVHWYTDGPPLGGYLDAVRRAAGTHEVWLSETGYASLNPQSQADYSDSMLQMFADASRPWWTHLIFYRLWDGQACCSDAIVTADYHPKPAFDVYRGWIGRPLARPRFPPHEARNTSR